MKVLQQTIAITLVVFASGCATQPSDQVSHLQSATHCCVTPQSLPVTAQLEGLKTGELTQSTPLIMVGTNRTPAVAFSLPPKSGGRELRIKATPQELPLTHTGRIVFIPVTVLFITADNKVISPVEDSGLKGISAESVMFSYTVGRIVKVPPDAVSAVFFADPARIGKLESLAYQTATVLMPAGGILIPMSGNGTVIANYGVYGKFEAKLM